MSITQATGFDANVIINDAVGTALAPGAYKGFARTGTSVNSTGPRQYALSNSPSGVLTAPAGSWAQVTGGSMWLNTDGATTWIQIG